MTMLVSRTIVGGVTEDSRGAIICGSGLSFDFQFVGKTACDAAQPVILLFVPL